jgi:spore coat protein U-like protein
VQIQVESVCVLTASDLVFPAYPAGSSVDVRTSATFLISCPGASPVEPTPVTMRFSTSSGEFAMTNRASRLVYQLCEDSACALPFAYDVAGGATAVTSDRQTYTIFGRIPRLQSPPAGLTYSQRVTATLTY